MQRRSKVADGNAGVAKEDTPLLVAGDSEYTLHESSNKASFWVSVVNLSLSAMGAGILTLPFGLAKSGVSFGTFLLFIFGFTSDYSLIFLVRAARTSGANSYIELGQKCFGHLGERVVYASLLGLLFMASIIVCITFAELFETVLQAHLGMENSFFASFNFLVFFILFLLTPLTSLDSLTALAKVSVLGILALFYVLTTLIYGVVDLGISNDVTYSYDSQFSNFMQAFSLQSLAFCCQFNIIDIYKELKDKSQIEPVCHFSLFGICFLVYAVFGLCGYLVCGAEVKDNVLTTSNFHGQAIFIFGTTAVALTNMAKYPLLALPLRGVLNDLCKFESFIDSKSKTVLEMLILNSLVGICSVILRNMTKAFNILGCTAGVLVCFILPGLFYHNQTKEISGLLLAIFGVICGIIIFIVTIWTW